MKRMLILAFGLTSLAASAAVAPKIAPDIAPAANLTAAQVVDKNVAARGGLDAWRAVKTMTLSGHLEAGGKANTELPFVMKMKRPHMSRLEIRVKDQTAVQVYDGQQGWKLRPFLGREEVEPFTPAETRAAAAWEELDGPLVDHASKGTKVEMVGTEVVEDHNSYKLKLTMKSGEVRHVWVDAKTFLERKMEGEPRKMDGKLYKVAIYFRDYRNENGLTVPHLQESVVEKKGVVPHKMRIERVAVNQSMDGGLFAKPQLAAASQPMEQRP